MFPAGPFGIKKGSLLAPVVRFMKPLTAAAASAICFLEVGGDCVARPAGRLHKIYLDGFYFFQELFFDHEGQPVLIENLVAIP